MECKQKQRVMKKVTVRFTVNENDNIYFATSHKHKADFCEENGFTVSKDYDITRTSIGERNAAYKRGNGVWCIVQEQW